MANNAEGLASPLENKNFKGVAALDDKNKLAAPSFRGPLRFELETSSSTLEAGRAFSVFVRITNPYDVPVKIIGVDTELPVEFWDPYDTSARRGIFHELKSIFVTKLATRTVRIFGKSRAESAANAGSSGQADAYVEPQGGPPPPVILQPGNSHLTDFTLKTRRKTFFSPSTYNLHLRVAYEMDGLLNHDSVKTQLNIKAPISAMTWGVLSGAIIGSFLRGVKFGAGGAALQPGWGWESFGVTALVGVLIGSVVVVAFARKKDAQPFVSVEDYYGGLFVGVVAGLSGQALLASVTSNLSLQPSVK